MDALHLLRAKREVVVDIPRRFGIVRQFIGAVLVPMDVIHIHADGLVPVPADLPPILEPLVLAARLHEELHLHLLELAHAKDEVRRDDLVAKRFADLRDAEGQAACASTAAHSGS